MSKKTLAATSAPNNTDTAAEPAAAVDVMAPVRARIEQLADMHDQLNEELADAREALKETWGRPVSAEQFADLVVRHHVDHLAAGFRGIAGLSKVLGAMLKPGGYRPTQPVDDKAAMHSLKLQTSTPKGQTGMVLCAADALALQRGGPGAFEHMAGVPQGALLGVGASDLSDRDRNLAIAAAIAFFGGDSVRQKVHTLALDFYREQRGGADSRADEASWDLDKISAEIEAQQDAVRRLEVELKAIDDELASLPAVHFGKNGEMSCQAQRGVYLARGQMLPRRAAG